MVNQAKSERLNALDTGTIGEGRLVRYVLAGYAAGVPVTPLFGEFVAQNLKEMSAE